MTRVFAVAILLLGIAQAAVGVVAVRVLRRFDEIAQLLEEAQMDPSAVKSKIFAISVALLIAASAFLVSAFGLLKRQEWARRLWLIAISLSLVFYAAWFVSHPANTVLAVSWIELFVVIAIFAVSWWYFNRRTVRQTFLVNRGR